MIPGNDNDSISLTVIRVSHFLWEKLFSKLIYNQIKNNSWKKNYLKKARIKIRFCSPSYFMRKKMTNHTGAKREIKKKPTNERDEKSILQAGKIWKKERKKNLKRWVSCLLGARKINDVSDLNPLEGKWSSASAPERWILTMPLFGGMFLSCMGHHPLPPRMNHAATLYENLH